MTISAVEFMKAVKKHGSIRAAARFHNIPKSTAQDLVQRARAETLRESRVRKAVRIAKPKPSEHGYAVKRFILSSAQDGTKVHLPFLRNLEAYAKFLDAEILISGFTYNKSLFEDHSKASGSYALELQPYITNLRFDLGSDVVFCGEMNILPTAVSPLSGLETYTRDKWGIFPHAKVQLKSIPTLKNSVAKMIMTTGTVTRPNYVLKKDGIKAHFHHVYGAVLVEIRSDGAFFCRHLLGEKSDGSFYDLDRLVKDEKVTRDHRALAMTWGDIHLEKIDWECAARSFGYDGSTEIDYNNLLDTLKPQFQFVHDIIDFSARNHHNIADPHFIYDKYVNGTDNVYSDIMESGYFLQSISRDFCQTVVVESNHDLALMKWLKTADYRLDPANAKFFLKAQAKVYDAIERGDKRFSVLEDTIREGFELQNVKFLREDDSFVIAKKAGGIECAMHGHLGANGARASSRSFARMGPKANVGHTHSAEIFDGIYTAGVTGALDMGYNRGLSSWSHSHIITYQNGKRAILTMNKGSFYA